MKSVIVVAAASVVAAACGGSPVAPGNIPTYVPSQDPSTAATLTYTRDIQPILAADCTACHGASRRDGGYDFTSYAGVLRAVSAGSASSPLVRATQPGGLMYGNFRGSSAAKAETIRRWVVDFGAAQ